MTGGRVSQGGASLVAHGVPLVLLVFRSLTLAHTGLLINDDLVSVSTATEQVSSRPVMSLLVHRLEVTLEAALRLLELGRRLDAHVARLALARASAAVLEGVLAKQLTALGTLTDRGVATDERAWLSEGTVQDTLLKALQLSVSAGTSGAEWLHHSSSGDRLGCGISSREELLQRHFLVAQVANDSVLSEAFLLGRQGLLLRCLHNDLHLLTGLRLLTLATETIANQAAQLSVEASRERVSTAVRRHGASRESVTVD